MKELKDMYFKQGRGNISGIHLDNSMRVMTHFINCDFHPNTWNLKYRSCVFESCQIKNCLTDAVDCLYLDDDGGVGC